MRDTRYCHSKITRQQFTGLIVQDTDFSGCDFGAADLTDTHFINCNFYDDNSRLGCSFRHGILQDTSFKHCDLSLADFSYAEAFGIELRQCKLQGADFRGANFANMINKRSYFCSAFISQCNLSYSNFSKALLEKCELQENRWNGAQWLSASFSGSDLSGGEFHQVDWQAANFTHCDLTNAELGGLDLRHTNLEGVKLESWQVTTLIENLGLIITDGS